MTRIYDIWAASCIAICLFFYRQLGVTVKNLLCCMAIIEIVLLCIKYTYTSNVNNFVICLWILFIVGVRILRLELITEYQADDVYMEQVNNIGKVMWGIFLVFVLCVYCLSILYIQSIKGLIFAVEAMTYIYVLGIARVYINGGPRGKLIRSLASCFREHTVSAPVRT